MLALTGLAPGGPLYLVIEGQESTPVSVCDQNGWHLQQLVFKTNFQEVLGEKEDVRPPGKGFIHLTELFLPDVSHQAAPTFPTSHLPFQDC